MTLFWSHDSCVALKLAEKDPQNTDLTALPFVSVVDLVPDAIVLPCLMYDLLGVLLQESEAR